MCKFQVELEVCTRRGGGRATVDDSPVGGFDARQRTHPVEVLEEVRSHGLVAELFYQVDLDATAVLSASEMGTPERIKVEVCGLAHLQHATDQAQPVVSVLTDKQARS